MGRPTRSSGGGGSSSSSGEEDEDAEWKAAIESITATTTFAANGFSSFSDGSAATKTAEKRGSKAVDGSGPVAENEEDDDQCKIKKPTHYQIKAQKLLDGILEKTLMVVSDATEIPDNDLAVNEGGVRLFKNAPLGIVFDFADEPQRPRRRPTILPGQRTEEKSKKLRKQLLSIAVDGKDILAAARDASLKSLARLEAKEAAAKEKAKKEEARVAELKRIRGEKWLPSIAREMQLKSSGSQV